jgi:hypothetical protein
MENRLDPMAHSDYVVSQMERVSYIYMNSMVEIMV